MSSEDTVYELTIDQPNLPKGELVQIPGLGTFKNGSSNTVTKDEAEAYRTFHSKVEPVVNEEDGSIIGSQVVPGPTLLQASKSMYCVEVTTSEAGEKKKDSGESKATPTQKGVELQNEKQQTSNEGTKTKSTEGGAS